MDQIEADEFESGLSSVFWRRLRERLAQVRDQDVADCCREGVKERDADAKRGRIELLDMILGRGDRPSLPDEMLDAFRKEE